MELSELTTYIRGNLISRIIIKFPTNIFCYGIN